ncbi:hypothetical protein COLO4_07978 [Corchorus olitorius]|uniref:Uncharacterized protein n=1 Tax=Corchorus olitorius TaxID=93759 RepID=A0A1R3KHV8_9ROSI|nr:hypothetical protein COLO4_07978 [Corchorus olitorius]
MENGSINHDQADIENNYSEEDLLKDFAEGIQSKFKIVKYYTQRPLKQDQIICCVDPLLREVNAAAYRPNFVIIGPLRCYDLILEKAEMQKRLYLNSFLQRAEKKANLNDFFKLIKDSASRIHGCYEEAYCRSWDFLNHIVQQNIPVSNTSLGLFIEMVLVDASFIIELFLRAHNKKESGGSDEFVFEGPGKMQDIRRDLFLAHNQLPFFILKDLYELAFSGNPEYPSFLRLTCNFFSPYYNQNESIQHIELLDNRAKLEGSKHFTDLLRTLQLPFLKENCGKGKRRRCQPQFVGRIKARVMSSLLPSSKKQEESEVRGEYLYSAVLLREAGVKFKASRSRCLLEIEFDNGELRIPCLRVDESTESFFRNLMAWEQRYYPRETHISDYIFLMEYLVKSTQDVDLLIRKSIIVNQLGSNTAVVNLFNNFCKHVTPGEKSRYANILSQLKAYSSVRHHSWIATLKLQHFSSPWKGVATIAAIVLLVLTLIQTICALISVI